MNELFEETKKNSAYIRKQGFNLVECWECEWREMKKMNKDLQQFIATRLRRPLDKVKTMSSLQTILDAVKNEKLFGCVECDIHVPEHLREKFSEMWKKFANDIKLKRTNVGTKQNQTKSGEGKSSAGSSILENKEITVQPLTTGKLKKYERTGPQEFVPFLFQEVTIENIILSCNKHFKNRLKGMSCDVLVSERGPSCTKITQLPNLKLIHVRFVMNNDGNSSSGISSTFSRRSSPYLIESHSQASTSKVAQPNIARSTSAIGLKQKSDVAFRFPSPVPKSLGVTSMIKLGKAITATDTLQEVVEVSVFDIKSMIWSPPCFCTLTIEKEMFAQGGFRAAYKATSKSPHFDKDTYIVKCLLPGTVELIGEVKETPEEQA